MPAKWNVFTNNFDLVSDVSSTVVGPAVATDNAVCRFDGTTGKLIQNSGATLSDADALSGLASVALDQGATIDEFSIDGTLAGNSDTALPTEQAVKTYVDNSTAPLPDAVYGGSASGHTVNTTTAFAPSSYRDFTTLEMPVRSFNTTTTEYMQFQFQVPSELDASGTVTFDIVGSSSTAAASKAVKYSFDFIQAADSGSVSGAYGGALTWDDQAVSATQNDIDIISNTETVANLGWTAGNMIFYRLYRSTATTGNLATDYDVISFNIRVPRA